MKKGTTVALCLFLHFLAAVHASESREMPNPLSKINIRNAAVNLDADASVTFTLDPVAEGQTSANTTVTIRSKNPTKDDFVAVFSPAAFLEADCQNKGSESDPKDKICAAPIKFQYCIFGNRLYPRTGRATLTLQLVNQRSDYSVGLFTGSLSQPTLVATSDPEKPVMFPDPKAPAFPRLALGSKRNEMAVTWTSGYGTEEAEPFVQFTLNDGTLRLAGMEFAETLTYDRSSLCDEPSRGVGWRDPGYTHTAILKGLKPNTPYEYCLAHRLLNQTTVFSKRFEFKTPPSIGQSSVQRVALFGSMGKAERDGSIESEEYQPGSIQTTDQLIKDLDNIDMVFHLGDLACAQGYLSQWDQFAEQIQPIASRVPYMVANGNRERDGENTGSFYTNEDSGGECGVPAETMFYVPAENRASNRYVADYGMFRFCVADTSSDWRKGTAQYEFLKECMSTVDRRKQPWLIFLAHRVLGYSSEKNYAVQGSFGEPMGRKDVQELLQEHKVDISMFGHAHGYERSCPVYQDKCTANEQNNYRGVQNGTINLVVGAGGSPLQDFADIRTDWSTRRLNEFGYGKLTAHSHSKLQFEYVRSRDGSVADSFTIEKEYRDILACSFDSCRRTTLAS